MSWKTKRNRYYESIGYKPEKIQITNKKDVNKNPSYLHKFGNPNAAIYTQYRSLFGSIGSRFKHLGSTPISRIIAAIRSHQKSK